MGQFVFHGPGQPQGIFNRPFFYQVMEIVLGQCGAENKTIKTELIKWQPERYAGLQAKGYCTNGNVNTAK